MGRLPFFDPLRAKGPRRGPDVGEDVTAEFVAPSTPPRPSEPAHQPLGVAELIAQVKKALAAALPRTVVVVGELSNVKPHNSGHLYFRLKDASAAIDAAMFRSAAAKLKFQPVDGLEVVVEGRVEVYDVRGQLQLYVERMTPRGAGALELALSQLRQKLQQEGLFDAAHKVSICRFPRAIGVITSPTGAAVRDIRRTLARRWPAAEVYLLPVLVQGDGAAADIAQAIGLMDANAQRLGIDTIIVGRGGGSVEDLWAFNEEVVARAVHACRTPIISGVGHEVDVTICDLVADVRAATPTAAAELAAPDRIEVARHLDALAARLARCLASHLRHARVCLEACRRSSLFRDPLARVRSQMQHVDELAHRLWSGVRHLVSSRRHRLEPAAGSLAANHPARACERAKAAAQALLARLRWALGGRAKRAGDILSQKASALALMHPAHRLALARQKLAAAQRHLEALSYRSVLARGYSVTRDGQGRIVCSVRQVRAGQVVQTELVDGMVRSRVEEQSPPASPPPAQRRRSTVPEPELTLFDKELLPEDL